MSKSHGLANQDTGFFSTESSEFSIICRTAINIVKNSQLKLSPKDFLSSMEPNESQPAPHLYELASRTAWCSEKLKKQQRTLLICDPGRESDIDLNPHLRTLIARLSMVSEQFRKRLAAEESHLKVADSTSALFEPLIEVASQKQPTGKESTGPSEKKRPEKAKHASQIALCREKFKEVIRGLERIRERCRQIDERLNSETSKATAPMPTAPPASKSPDPDSIARLLNSNTQLSHLEMYF